MEHKWGEEEDRCIINGKAKRKETRRKIKTWVDNRETGKGAVDKIGLAQVRYKWKLLQMW
jgi:hypothetical protein